MPDPQNVLGPAGVIAAKGAALTVKANPLVPVPLPLVTEIVPVVVPAAGVAVICVLLLTVKDAALVPLNLTTVDPVKWSPVITTGPKLLEHSEVGEILVNVGLAAIAGIAVKSTMVKHKRSIPHLL